MPEAITVGENEEDALIQGLDALEVAFDIYFAEKRAIPRPSRVKRGQPAVTLPALVASKVLLANELLAQNLRMADLARRMKVNQVQIDRMLKMGHPTRIESIEAAPGAHGKHLEVRLAA